MADLVSDEMFELVGELESSGDEEKWLTRVMIVYLMGFIKQQGLQVERWFVNETKQQERNKWLKKLPYLLILMIVTSSLQDLWVMRVRIIFSKIIINACNMMEKNWENQWLPKLPRDSSYKAVRINNSQM